MKTCSACKIEKPLSDFAFKRKADGVVQSKCKVCYTAYNRSYYQTDAIQRAKQRDRIKANKRLVKDQYIEWKKQQRCSQCDESSYECLDLHHLDPTVKDGNLSRMTQDATWNRIKQEIEKCVVVCANCHRKIHSGRITLTARSITDNAPVF